MIKVHMDVQQVGTRHVFVRTKNRLTLLDLSWLADARGLTYDINSLSVHLNDGCDTLCILDGVSSQNFVSLITLVAAFSDWRMKMDGTEPLSDPFLVADATD